MYGIAALGGALTVTLGLRGNVERFSHSSP
mgnify:CR=1 FL=1